MDTIEALEKLQKLQADNDDLRKALAKRLEEIAGLEIRLSAIEQAHLATGLGRPTPLRA